MLLRWLVTLAAPLPAPATLLLVGPAAGLVVAVLSAVAWTWWSAPAVGINMNPLNKALILGVLAADLTVGLVAGVALAT